MPQEIDDKQRQKAADRLMRHLLQKGRPAPYKAKLIAVLADPVTVKVPTTLVPSGEDRIGLLGQLVLTVETWIRQQADPDYRPPPHPAAHSAAKTTTAR